MPNAMDLKGQKFNRLTAIKYIGSGTWHCKCDCGNYTNATTGNLRSGHTKSCGCLNKEVQHRVDLTGKRFGRLTVVSRAETYISPNGKFRASQWNCVCDCGNECTVNVHALRKGRTKSCGCLHEENLDGLWKKKKKKRNKYEVVGNTVYVEVEKTKEKIICDLDVWENLKGYYWYLDGHGYPMTMLPRKKKAFMHKMIMKENVSEVVDHINRNKLDNRKENLRYTTIVVNAQNRSLQSNNKSGHVGVYKVKNHWVAWIGAYCKRIYLGSFKTKEEAIKAREEAEKIYHSEK